MSDPNSGYNSNNAIPRKPISMFRQYDDGVYNVRIEVVGDEIGRASCRERV